jgi:regulator of cell morphogenesis and NO signaling
MQNFKQESVGMLVAEQPLRAAVFDRFGIDFCCGGKQTLEEACEKIATTPESVIAELRRNDEMASNDSNKSENWLNVSMTALADHIQQTHHAYLKEELPRLQSLADKVARVHGSKDPRLTQVVSVFAQMKEELLAHAEKEEIILFPFIRRLDQGCTKGRPPFGTVDNPVRCLESEHKDAGDALFRLRELTDNYTAPEQACSSWVALLAGLAHLDLDLRIHIHKESTILFPKAIEAERHLAAIK